MKTVTVLPLLSALLSLACLPACGGASQDRADAPRDAGRDVPDAARDAGIRPDARDGGDSGDIRADAADGLADTPTDGSAIDAAPDALPLCVCSEGPCCAGFELRPAGVVCDEEAASGLRCVPNLGCGGTVERRTAARLCSGASALCDGPLAEWGPWEPVANCAPEETCDTGAGGCVWNADCTCETRCNDGDPCTRDRCRPDGACEHEPETCDDGDACTADACVPGVGCVSRPVECDDADPCTTDGCDPLAGCQNTPLTCDDDGDPCTDNVCVAGRCEAVAASCDDGDHCTLDYCNSSGCHSVPGWWAGPCTRYGQAGRCYYGECCIPRCDDRGCGPDGCGRPCAICGENGRCIDGQCCDRQCEGRECGPDGCGGECGTCPDGQQCKEGTCCTPDCSGRECGANGCGGQCGECDDGSRCTEDSCDASGHCVFGPYCPSDGIECTWDVCYVICRHIPEDFMCDDHVPCTLDLCLPDEGGCKNRNLSCDCIDDELEDNDTVAQAMVLTEGLWTFEPIAAWGDPDVWRIDAVPGARVLADVYASATPEAPVLVELFNANVVIATAEGLPQGGAVDEVIPDRDAYYLRVKSSVDLPCLPYLLIVSITAPDVPPLECNSLCPSLPCYTAECNAQGSCEYHPDDAAGWREREVLVWIPPKTVPMGAAGQPVVSVGRGFFIDKYEVSAEEYLQQPRCRQPQANCFDKSSMGTDPEGYRVTWDDVTTLPLVAAHCETGVPGERGSCADHPMTYVRHRDAVLYCRWRGGTLCTEAQWELAAKGSTQQMFPWGDAPEPGEVGWDPPRANCAEELCADGFERTAPVDAFPEGVSPAGVFGMAGNVAEWVWDHWVITTGELPADFPLDGSSWLGGIDAARVVRGAAWRAFDSDTTLMETRHGSAQALEWVGFRCCRRVPEESAACECTDDECP